MRKERIQKQTVIFWPSFEKTLQTFAIQTWLSSDWGPSSSHCCLVMKSLSCATDSKADLLLLYCISLAKERKRMWKGWKEKEEKKQTMKTFQKILLVCYGCHYCFFNFITIKSFFNRILISINRSLILITQWAGSSSHFKKRKNKEKKSDLKKKKIQSIKKKMLLKLMCSWYELVQESKTWFIEIKKVIKENSLSCLSVSKLIKT